MSIIMFLFMYLSSMNIHINQPLRRMCYLNTWQGDLLSPWAFQNLCFSLFSKLRESSKAPMVIKPSKRSLGVVKICWVKITSSELSRSDHDVDWVSRGRPDFESSPEVCTCTRTLRGDERFEGSAFSRAEAAFTDPGVWTLKRLDKPFKFG